MSDFARIIQDAAAKEAHAALSDTERMGAMVEVLARALGFTIAMCAQGDPKTIGTLLTGAEAYAHEEAVSKARFARLMHQLTGGRS